MDAATRLPRVRVPVLALQGEHDEYGTLLQLRRVSRGVSGRCETRLLTDCGHGPHLQDEATTVEVIARFVSTLWRGPAAAASRIVSAVVLGCLLASAGEVQAQTVSCEPAEVRTVLQRAADELQRMDEAAARAVLFTADGRWRRPAASWRSRPSPWKGGSKRGGWPPWPGRPISSARINQVLKRLEALRISGTPTSLTVQLASYAEAVLRAAVAAAQDERDEMQVYLALGRDLAVSLALGAQTRLWPLPIDEVEGELWLEVDRFADARAAFERAAAAGRGARGTIGLALTADRLKDVPAACAAYLRADTMSVADGPRQTIRAAAARLGVREALTRMPRYRPEVLDELGRHGLAPARDTQPPRLREQINDLYRIEIRKLRDRCRAGEIPVRELPAHVVELRKRYMLLSIPMDTWVEPDP